MFFKNKKLKISLILVVPVFMLLSQVSFSDLEEFEKNSIRKESLEEEYFYTKNLTTSVFKSPKKDKSIDILSKNSRVVVLTKKYIEIFEKIKVEDKKKDKKKKEIKPFVNDDEKVKINFEDGGEKENIVEKKEKLLRVESWAYIKYRKNLKIREGWILENKLVSNSLELLPKSWRGLQVSNFPEKKEFSDNPKKVIKGIYVLDYSASSEKKINALIKLAKETEINAFVIDVKDDFGHLLWKMDESILKYNKRAFSKTYIKNIETFMKKLKDNNIYAIARIVSFKDPNYAKENPDKAIIEKSTGKPYKNRDGIIWVSPHDKNLWEYNIAIAKEAAKVGFNEIQFDYVRFPASNGGKLDKFLDYRNTENDSKPVTIQKYLKYAWEELTPMHVYINADIYGQIGTFKDDMGLGQYWEALSGYTHYLSPMMYPSHYNRGAYGVNIPDAEPYKIIYRTTLDSINRNENINSPAEIRPWLQDFTAKWIKGHINYTEKEIRQQIKALNDLGIHSYLLWSASNRYHI